MREGKLRSFSERLLRSIAALLFLLTWSAIGAQPSYSWWYHSSWGYRKAITIDHDQVSADLPNFSVLIDITDSDLASKAQSDGDDILFTANDGVSKLAHEIESYVQSAGGRLVAWVRMPSLLSATDTTVYMYYGNPSAANQENVSGVWDANYVLVHHLEETSGTHYDSTSHANNGTPYNGVNQNVSGKINGADSFDGTNDYVNLGNGSSVNLSTSDFTVQTWFKTSSSTWAYFVTKGGASGAGGEGYGIDLYSGDPRGFIHDGTLLNWTTADLSYNDDEWHHYVAVFDRDGVVSPYVDGIPLGTTTISARSSSVSGSSSLYIGLFSPDSRYFGGSIDEVRLSNAVRSEAWIQTEYANQNSPSTFFSVGAEEANPTAVTFAAFSAESIGSAVALRWETATELDNLGFNLYRAAAADGPRTRLNPTLIPSQNPGSPVGASYQFVDDSVEAGVTYFYWLEDMDVHGAAALHGPVSASLDLLRRLLPARPRLAPHPPIQIRR